jgi:hypothetical protein
MGTHVGPNLLSHFLRGSLNIFPNTEQNSVLQCVHGQFLVRDGFGSGPSFPDHCAPEWLVAKERNDYSRFPQSKSYCSRSRSPMMTNGRNVFEELVMRYILRYHEYVGWDGGGSQTTPAC